MYKYQYSDLRAGDCLLYKPQGAFGLLISVKTWHDISHCEVYEGQGYSVASRDPDHWFPKPSGGGVNRYPWRDTELACVLRPNRPFNQSKATTWFEQVRGQSYDWAGLLRFGWRARVVPTDLSANKMFCSECNTRYYRAGDFDPFPREDADAVAPFEFASNPFFDLVTPTLLIKE